MRSDAAISHKNTNEVSSMLTSIIADEMVLLVKTKNYRWNVSGVNFDDYHVLFQHQYSRLENAIDEIAKRVRSLGSFSIGSMKDFLEHTQLKESDEYGLETEGMLYELLKDHELIINNLRHGIDVSENKYNDIQTSACLNKLTVQHEKMAWMLTTYLV